MLRSSGRSSEPARRHTHPASSSGRRASCAPARFEPWRAGPGLAQGSPCWTCAAEWPGQDGSSLRSWAVPIWGWTSVPARSRSHVSAHATSPVASRSRGSPRSLRVPFEVVLLLETMLAFPDKEPLLREISRALTAGGRFAFTLEEGPPLTEAERERMPDADTVWVTPLVEMLAGLERVGLVVRWQQDCSRSHRAMADSLIERVRRRCAGHCRADRTPGARGAAGRPPALERLAAGRTGPQARVCCGAAVSG